MIELDDIRTPSTWHDVACAALETSQYLCKKPAADYLEPDAIGSFVGSDVRPRICQLHLFTCDNSECVQAVYLCDGREDCSDGSDESSCASRTYDVYRFRCIEHNETIPASFFCDFRVQCDSTLDETGCVYPVCTESQFTCASGECIDLFRQCDLVADCQDGSDLESCSSFRDSFQCYSGNWIPGRTLCDGITDCLGFKTEDEDKCDYGSTCINNSLQCNSEICVSTSHICAYDIDEYGYFKGCRDLTHLRNCELFECPDSTFKCPNSYCIPLSFRCDNKNDCPNGEDELQCDNYICPGAYRCRLTKYCIRLDQVCDGVYDCSTERDDELFCSVQCPSGCECVGLSYSCQNVDWNLESANMISTNVRQLFLNSIKATSTTNTGRRKRRQTTEGSVAGRLHIEVNNYGSIFELHLINNGIKELQPMMFAKNPNLLTLNLSGNNVDVLRNQTFQGLHRLYRLSLADNLLGNVEVGAFAGLTNLHFLDIRGISPIRTREVFDDLTNLTTIDASQFLFCCLSDREIECLAPVDSFSDCRDLIRNGGLRFFIWLLGISALVGNLLVFGLRVGGSLRRHRHGHKREIAAVQTLLIANLAASDFLMGVYMIIIASADAHFRNNYALFADSWREGVVCKIAGFLSVLSSEVSVFIVMLLSIDRFVKIVFPFRYRIHLTVGSVKIILGVFWMVGIVMSLLPAVIVSYFTSSYYGQSSVCLALPLTLELQPGWQYMFFLLSVNLVCFLVILGCYVFIFIAVKKSSHATKNGRIGVNGNVSDEIKLAAKLSLIVGTDFLCWMPIIILAMVARSPSVNVPIDVYAWFAVFVLPLNSSLNPYLYTLSAYWGNRKRKLAKSALASSNINPTPSPMGKSRTSSTTLHVKSIHDRVSTIDMEMKPTLRVVLAELKKHCIIFGCESTKQYIAEAVQSNHAGDKPKLDLTEADIASIEEDINKALSWLHANNIHGIQLREECILFSKDSNGHQRAYLKLPQDLVGSDDAARQQQTSTIGVELDKTALDNLIGRLRNRLEINYM